jgi:hypothetical protein
MIADSLNYGHEEEDEELDVGENVQDEPVERAVQLTK